MNLIQEAGTYRGVPTDWGVGESTGGYPQFVMALYAKEVWDPEGQEWYGAEGDPEITAYLILFDSKGQATRNVDQLKSILGWSGNSFAELNDGQYAECGVQFRVEEQEYENKKRIKVVWISEYDAIPGRSVQKLDTKKLKDLDKKWSKFMGGGKVQAAKATPGKVTRKQKTATEAQADLGNIPGGPEPKPSAPANRIPPAAPKPVAGMTKQIAWEYAVNNTEGYDDELRAEKWAEAIAVIASKKKDADITRQEWQLIAEATVESVTGNC